MPPNRNHVPRRADAELLIAQPILVMMRHVVLDQKRRALDTANEIGLVTPSVEITMTDLSVVFLADGIVALTVMH